MSRRELIALGINIKQSEEPEPREELETVTNSNMNDENPIVAAVTIATTAIQVNKFHNVIDLSSVEGKKLHQKATQGFPEE